MKIGGLQKSTLIDYPGKVAATIFVLGCNFKCGFCHNPELVLPDKMEESLSDKEVFKFLKERKGFLNGVVVCGGEPTIHPDLEDFISEIKDMEFSIKLDTNGYNPEMLRKLVSNRLVDYAAMDIKASKDKYSQVAGIEVDISKIEESIEIVKKMVDYEFRTTLVPGLVEGKEILAIAQWISPAKKYILQNFSNVVPLIDESLKDRKPFEREYLENLKDKVETYFDVCRIR